MNPPDVRFATEIFIWRWNGAQASSDSRLWNEQSEEGIDFVAEQAEACH